MWDLRKNYTAHHHNPIPLQAYPYPGSCMRMRLGAFYTRLDNVFLSKICKPTEYVYMQYVVGNVLQVTLDLFWTPRGPTSSVTALMIASTCSMSVGLKPLQVKNDYKLNVKKKCPKACVLEFNANYLLLHDTRWGCRPMFCALAVFGALNLKVPV